jgi:hypothetical protein
LFNCKQGYDSGYSKATVLHNPLAALTFGGAAAQRVLFQTNEFIVRILSV